MTLTAYIDVKSPYAYLAIEPTRRLARRTGIDLNWLPYTLDIPDYLGAAEVDATGRVISQDRTAHQWRRVRYAYMDVRRYANLRGLTIRGTRKIWDSSLASIALLWARDRDGADAFLDAVFPPFWRRELDIEDIGVISDTLAAAGIECEGFTEWAADQGRALHDRLRDQAEQAGVFGVPWYVWGDEVFWGREALPLIGYRITGELPDWAADMGLAPDR